jgi:hypothetical protein
VDGLRRNEQQHPLVRRDPQMGAAAVAVAGRAISRLGCAENNLFSLRS